MGGTRWMARFALIHPTRAKNMEKGHLGFKWVDGLNHTLRLKNLGCTRWMARFALIHPTTAKNMGKGQPD